MPSATPTWLEAAFLEEFLVVGPSLPLAHYQACFPGQDQRVAELYSRHATDFEARHAEHRIGRYVVHGILGRGGQGVVYKAHDPELDREVAIKVGHAADDSTVSALRLVREARVGARLAHPGICPVLDHGIQDGAPYVVMPYLEGWSLRQLLQCMHEDQGDNKLRAVASHAGLDSIDGVVRFLARLASAMGAAHATGIVHRDLKPTNILVRPDGAPVILDLGLAKDESRELPTLTGGADLVGTPAYFAPEQWRAGARVGPAADVWALGVMLSECLTGERPFPGPGRELLCRQVLETQPRPLREQIGPVPRDLQTILDVALQKDVSRRYANASELADDLDRFLERRPILARTPGPVVHLWLWARRRPALATTVSGLFLCLVAALVTMVFLLRERDRSAQLAEERYGTMRQVTDDIVFDLIQRLASVPGTVQVRRKLADRAVEYLGILTRENPTDNDLRYQVIVARMRLGDALGSPHNQSLHLPDRALEQFHRARREAMALQPDVGAGPLASRLAKTLMDCDNRIGRVLIGLGRFAEGREYLRRVRDQRVARYKARPDDLLNLSHLCAVVADLSACARSLSEGSLAAELAFKAIELTDRLAASSSDDPAQFEQVAQATQVACVLRERLGRAREALEVLLDMHPKVKELAARHPERELLQHSAIVFGMHIGRQLLMYRRVEEARPVYADTLERLGRSQQHERLRLRVLFEYGQGLVNNRLWKEGLEQLGAAEAGCKSMLEVSEPRPTVQKLLCHVRMQQSLAHAETGNFEKAKDIAGALVTESTAAASGWSEERLRHRVRTVMVYAQVLILAREMDAARELLARERRFFEEQRFDDQRDRLCKRAATELRKAERQVGGR